MEMEKIFSKDFMKGFKTAVKMCKDVAEKNGYELYIPDIEEITVKKIK